MARRLTGMQHLFALEYVICKNGTEAARRAGYKGDDNVLAVTAYNNLRNPKIADFINERFSETAMRADEVVARLSDQAASDMTDFLKIQHGIPFFDLEVAKKRNKLHLIKKFKTTDKGVEVELYDAQSALKTLAQYHGLLKPDVQINISIELITQTVNALEKAGLNPSDIFNQLIQQAAEVEVDAADVRAGGAAQE